jgi:branched-chain amino acid transport system substrate-binding protein
VLAVVGGAALVVLAGAVAFTFSKPVKKMDAMVEAALTPPPRPRGVTGDELVLGMAGPLSGANRELGRGMNAGIEAALADVNAAGGVHGRRLRLVVVDDGYEPARTLAAMRQLVEQERVFAVIGNVGTPTAAVSIPYCMERQVLFFGALSGGDLLRKSPPDRYVFTFRPSYAEETAAAVRWLTGKRRVPPGRIAVFAQQDEFGDSGFRGAAEALRARGVDPAAVLRVGYRRNTADVANAVRVVGERARDVDAVVMVATYRAAAAFVRGLRDARLRHLVTNVSAVDPNALAEELVAAGPHYADGVFVTQVVPPPSARLPATARFREAMARHAPTERPGFVAMEGWSAAQVLVEGLRRAGRDLDTDEVIRALEQVRDADLGVHVRISFNAQDHQGSRQVFGSLLQADGSYRPVALE